MAAVSAATDETTGRYKRPESVLVLVYTSAGEVLLLRRADDADFWQSVTGSLEPDETPAQAAPRELAEETGITGVAPRDRQASTRFVIYPQFRHRYAPGVTHNLEHVFTVELAAPVAVRLAPREHLEYRWLARDEAIRLARSPSNRAAIERFVPAPRGG